MCEHDALGITRGARGVDDAGKVEADVARGQCIRRRRGQHVIETVQGCSTFEIGRRVAGGTHHEHVGEVRSIGHAIGPDSRKAAVGNEHSGPTVVEHIRELVDLGLRADHRKHRVGFKDAHDGHAGFDGVVGKNHDPIASSHP